jgi:hypothetical protein
MHKRICTLFPLLVAWIPAASAQPIRADSFDALPVGSLPDCGAPLGYWDFRQDFGINWCEVNAADTQIVPTGLFQPGAAGNSLAQRTDSGSHVALASAFPSAIVAVPGQILVVDFDLWVVANPPDLGGGMVFLCNDDMTRRGPFCNWRDDGILTTTHVNTSPPPCHTEPVLAYPRDQWQHVRYVVDLNQNNWDLWWWLDGQAPVRYLDHRQFFSPQPALTAFCFGRFTNNALACGGEPFAATSSYLDNVSIFVAPDCNGNRRPDAEDIAVGFSRDLNQNGIPDECECYANCDQSTTAPVLNVLDFNCFLNQFAAGEPYANCDGSTTPPTLNVLDFNCFLNQFSAGCN